jgi:hypothetical protein
VEAVQGTKRGGRCKKRQKENNSLNDGSMPCDDSISNEVSSRLSKPNQGQELCCAGMKGRTS